MQNYFTLLKVMFPEALAAMGSSTGSFKRRKNTKVKTQNKTIKIPYLLLLYLAISAIMCSSYYSMLKNAPTQNAADAILYAMAPLAIVMTLVVSFMQSLTYLYFDSKIDRFLVLPCKNWEIIAAKLSANFLISIMPAALITLPCYLVYGIMYQRPWYYYILTLITFIANTLCPYLLMLIPIYIIMCFGKFAKNKERFRMVSNIIFFVLIVTVSVGANLMSQTAMNPSIHISTTALGNIFSFLPTAFWTNKMLYAQGFAIFPWAGLLLLAIVICIGANLLVGNKFYLRGALAMNENSQKKKSVDLTKDKGTLKLNKILRQNEYRFLLRSPAFMTNFVLASFIMPVMLMISLIIVLFKAKMSIAEAYWAAGAYFATMPLDSYFFIVAGISVGVFALSSAMTFTSGTAVSRMKNEFEAYKTLPIKSTVFFSAWLAPGILFSFAPPLLLLLTAAIFLRLSLWHTLIIMAIALTTVYCIQVMDLCLDLWHPNFHWDDEVQISKQSKTVFVGMLTGYLLLGIYGGIFYLLLSCNFLSVTIKTGILFAIIALGAAIFTVLAKKLANTLFARF